jgi:hypothetical protein
MQCVGPFSNHDASLGFLPIIQNSSTRYRCSSSGSRRKRHANPVGGGRETLEEGGAVHSYLRTFVLTLPNHVVLPQTPENPKTAMATGACLLLTEQAFPVHVRGEHHENHASAELASCLNLFEVG